MATLEELRIIAEEEVENSRPLYKQVNNEVLELTEEEYVQKATDLANYRYELQETGYIAARQDSYLPLSEQLDMMYWDAVNGTTTWQDHIAQVKSDNPKPS
jgi:hypothetical protein